MNSKIIIGIAVGIAIIFGGIYAVSDIESQTESVQEQIETDEQPVGKVVDVNINENLALGNE